MEGAARDGGVEVLTDAEMVAAAKMREIYLLLECVNKDMDEVKDRLLALKVPKQIAVVITEDVANCRNMFETMMYFNFASECQIGDVALN